MKTQTSKYPKPRNKFQAIIGLLLMAKYEYGKRDKVEDMDFIKECYNKIK